MKQICSLLAIVALVSCGHPSVKFIPKLDSVQVVYKDSVQGPFLFTGIYQTTRTFLPVDSSSTVGFWHTDTLWAMKIQTDTLKVPNAIHSYRYQQVNKKYVQIIAPK